MGIITSLNRQACSISLLQLTEALPSSFSTILCDYAGAFGFFMKSDTNDVGFSTITRSGIAVAGPLCLPKDGVSGAGECFDFASDSNDLFSLQALSYQNNLIGPWMLDSVAEKCVTSECTID
jgi:hypothetical protein